MGLGNDSDKTHGIMDPPIFQPDLDLIVWRKKVTNWVNLISTAPEKRQNKLYKTVFATLGPQFYYRGLHQNQKNIFDKAQEDGNIHYRQDDQVKAVQEIVEFIADDSPIAVGIRPIDSFNKFTNCKRK